MRLIVSISFLFLFIVVWFRPYYPHLNYAVNKKYIAEIKCENKNNIKKQCEGKCYLTKKVKENSEEKNQSQPVPIAKNLSAESIYINVIEINSPLPGEFDFKKQKILLNVVLPEFFINTPAIPPEEVYC